MSHPTSRSLSITYQVALTRRIINANASFEFITCSTARAAAERTACLVDRLVAAAFVGVSLGLDDLAGFAVLGLGRVVTV